MRRARQRGVVVSESHRLGGREASVTSIVKSQYAELPYPPRNPADERVRLLPTLVDDLDSLSHYGFGGEPLPEPFNVLVAGGGTGDSTVFLAEQLKDRESRIVQVDLSRSSLKVVAARLAARGLLGRVELVEGSLLDLDKLDIGLFDYVNCTGVLHHLEDPEEGLRSLVSVLAPGGLLGLMLYGTYGRFPIYPLQELLRIVAPSSDHTTDRIAVARRLLERLPPSHWLKRGPDMQAFGVELQTDSGLFDLLLHSQDRSYTVAELYELLEESGLVLVEHSPEYRPLYRSEVAFQDDTEMAERVAALPRMEREAACEVYWCCLNKHVFWASRKDRSASFDDDGAVPFYAGPAKGAETARSALLADSQHEIVMELERTDRPTLRLALELTPVVRAFLRRVDGQTPVSEIVRSIVDDLELQHDEVLAECRETFERMRTYELMLLKRPRS